MSRPPLLDETNLSSEQKLIFDNIRSGPLRTGNHYGWRLLEIRFEWHVHAPIAARYGVTTDVIAYEEGCKQSGRPVDFNNWCVAKSIFVAKNEATARNYARGAGSPYVHYFSSLFTKLVKNGRSNLFKEDPDMPDSALKLDTVMDRCVIHGSPKQVAEKILAFRDEVGPFGTLLYAGHDWVDPVLAKDSMRMMAEDVLPLVNQRIGKQSLMESVA